MPSASRLVTYTIGTGAVRTQVSLQLDANGRKLRYTEVRGDLEVNSSNPATSIHLDFVRGTAQASNELPNGLEVANGSLAEALQAANLGVPQSKLDLIEQRCLKH